MAFFSSRTAFSSPQSFLARGQFFWFQLQHPHSLPLLFLGISRHQPTGDLPATRPTATRTLHAKTLELVVSSLFSPSFLLSSCSPNSTWQHTTQQARRSPEPRARSVGPRPALDFFRRWRHQRRRQGRPLRPLQSSHAALPPLLPSSVFPYLTTSLSLDHFMNWAGPRPSGWRCSTGCANLFEMDATCWNKFFWEVTVPQT